MSARRYEMMVILDPGIEDRTIAASLEKFLAVVGAQGGSIDKVDIWGRRRMSFDIKKKSEGIYAVVDFTATSATAHELDRQLGLNEAVLRTKILRTDA
jgi:small subunit ribosomal protein S6